MKLFKKRVCPACAESNANIVAIISLNTLLQCNPGYNVDWFARCEIPSEKEFKFVRCKSCDFVYVNEILSENILFKYYNEGIDEHKSKAKIYHGSKRNFLIEKWRTLHSLLEVTSVPIKVLDFGAGWGDFLAVAKCIGVEVYGLEFDRRKIEFASKHGVYMGDFDEIVRKAPYDIFFCNQVLEHLDNPREILKQLRSVLKVGSVGFISVPDFSDRNIEKEIECLKNGSLPSKDFDPLGHLNYFNASSLRTMVLGHGFQEVPRYIPKKMKHKLAVFAKNMFAKQASENTSIFVKAVER